MENNDFYDKVADDVKQVLIQFLSEAGWGKTSSLKTIIQHCKNKHKDLVFKIFDISIAWWHTAPVKYRQSITFDKIQRGEYANIEDCVYDIGSLDKTYKRAFIGYIMKQDYEYRYTLAKDDPEKLKSLPYIIYVIEEANVCFGPYSLRTNDEYSPIFQQFVSVGRNFKMRGILVATAEVGEISPSLRDRSRRIYGRIESERDLKRLRSKDKALAKYISTKLPRYHFVYYDGRPHYSGQIPDSVTNVPIDYVVTMPDVEVEEVSEGNGFSFWRYILVFLFGYILGWLFG